MRYLPTLFKITCFLYIASACFAATDTKTDADPDKRLDQTVTMQMAGRPLRVVLEDLSAKTGVKMVARKDVAEDKLALFVKDLPLSDLQDAIKEVLHLRCTQLGKKGEWYYEFWMDLKTEQSLNPLYNETIVKLRNRMQRLANDLKLSPEELEEKYKNDSFTLSQLKHELGRPALSIYAGLSDEQLDSLYSNGRLSLRHEDIADAFAGLGVTGMQMNFGEVGAGAGKFLICMMSLGQSSPQAAGDPVKINSVMLSFGLDQADLKKARQAISAKGEKPVGISMSLLEGSTLYELLCKVAEKTGVNIVSDYFTCKKLIKMTVSDEKYDDSDALLRQIADCMSYQQSKKQNIHRFISNEWAENRATEIPEHVIERWKTTVTKCGWEGIRTAIEMAQLTNRQRVDLNSYDLGGRVFIGPVELLRFLGVLTPEQWRQSTSKDGLVLSSLNDDQRRHLFYWAREDNISALKSIDLDTSPPVKLMTRVNDMSSDKAPSETWEFRLVGDSISHGWTVELPLVRTKGTQVNSGGSVSVQGGSFEVKQ